MPYFSSYLQQPQFFHTNASGHSRKSIRNRNRHSHAAITKNCCSILMPCIAFTSLWTEISKACMPLSLSRKCETLFQIMCQDEEVATGEAQSAEASLGTRKRYQKQDLPPKPRNHQSNSSPQPAAHSSCQLPLPLLWAASPARASKQSSLSQTLALVFFQLNRFADNMFCRETIVRLDARAPARAHTCSKKYYISSVP